MLHAALSAAAVIASFAFCAPPVLQLAAIVRQRSARAVSLGSFLLSVTCLAAWLAYGIDITSLPLIVSTALELAANIAVVIAILIMRRR